MAQRLKSKPTDQPETQLVLSLLSLAHGANLPVQPHPKILKNLHQVAGTSKIVQTLNGIRPAVRRRAPSGAVEQTLKYMAGDRHGLTFNQKANNLMGQSNAISVYHPKNVGVNINREPRGPFSYLYHYTKYGPIEGIEGAKPGNLVRMTGKLYTHTYPFWQWKTKGQRVRIKIPTSVLSGAKHTYHNIYKYDNLPKNEKNETVKKTSAYSYRSVYTTKGFGTVVLPSFWGKILSTSNNGTEVELAYLASEKNIRSRSVTRSATTSLSSSKQRLISKRKRTE